MKLKYQIIAFLIIGIFYGIFLGKMMLQKKQGITTNQMAKDRSDKKRYLVECLLGISSLLVVIALPVSILYGYSLLRYSGKTPGIILGVTGNLIFLAAVITLGSSWRAGVAAGDHRKFVSRGIFRISRNPAFLGFDLIYIGILLMFFNWFLLTVIIFAMILLHLQIRQEERYLAVEFPEDYPAYKRKVCRYFGLKKWKFWVVLAAGLLLTGFLVINSLNQKIEALPEMSFEECLAYTTKGNSDSVITVGVYKNGEQSFHVYGENGKELEPEIHNYEIGSLTKTMTASCINQAISEGKLLLSDTIDQYLNLPVGKKYPTIEELLTHTSGYNGYYLNKEMIYNAVIGGAPFRHVTGEQILKEAGKENLTKDSYEWNYSNFGYALLGLVLEEVYKEDFAAVMNRYLQELGMKDSVITNQQGDLGKCWKWEMDDAYTAAGAVHSNICDMLKYAALQLTDETMENAHIPLHRIENKNSSYDAMNIHIDEIAMAWILDDTNHFIWHNGGTDDYNSYLGFCKGTDTAVVILSNLPDDYRIPATVLGTKLLAEIQN